MKNQKELFDFFESLNIKTTTAQHKPVFTVEEALKEKGAIQGAPVKNLFLKDDKKRFWLIVAHAETPIQLKEIAIEIKAPKLRFAQANLLQQYLGVEPGSVTPLGLINDTEHKVHVILDKRLCDYDIIGVHPLVNSATTAIAPKNLQKFIAACGNELVIHSFNSQQQGPRL